MVTSQKSIQLSDDNQNKDILSQKASLLKTDYLEFFPSAR